ncbi:ankyrin 2-3/unc44 [Penicillium longicatenatum]|uniref:ankyrin 2-3/unc44 n=1 Tax=Penicillium longicatenatum TaxID=1561947 RepID=UPI002547AB74|nr:ankyrin 2-3/unc44 [Penicillium longicatenatum]KAJ5636659.1 ankyrin 2-3/unc44 [Penicillium longicatenatum]
MCPMSMLRLPNELILHIATFLKKDRDIASLLQTNRRLKTVLGECLFQNNLSINDGSALPLCAKYGVISGVQTLLKLGAAGDETDSDSRTVWTYAAENGDFGIWQMLLDHEVSLGLKPDMNKKDDYHGRTPLSWAAQGGQLEFAQYLVKFGAKLDAKCSEKRTPLSYAAQSGHSMMVQWLLDQGANLRDSLHREDRDGLTPLHYAAFEGHEDIMRLLISLGADIDCMESDCMDLAAQTPLMEAARGGQYTVVKMLLEMGTKASEGDGRGMSPLQYAARAGVGEPLRESEYHIPDYMCEQPGPGWYFDGAGYQATQISGNPVDYLAIVKLLVAHGADPNEVHEDHYGHPQGGPLYCASWAGATDIVEFLIEMGADINKMSAIGGRTALHAAVRNGHLDVTEKLLVNGANVNARDGTNHTPLDRAIFAARIANQGKYIHEYGSGWRTEHMLLFEANLQKYQQVVDLLIAHGGEVGREDAFIPW